MNKKACLKVVIRVLIGIVIGVLIGLLVKVIVNSQKKVTYTYEGEAISSDYEIVGSTDDFEIVTASDGTTVYKWTASGKYDSDYCYVIPPLSEFKKRANEVESIAFDSHCKEVYFADGCPPLYNDVTGDEIEAAYISASVAKLDSITAASVNFSELSHMAISPRIADNDKIETLVFPANISEVTGLQNLENLKSVKLPQKLKNITESFINCPNVENVKVPYDVTESVYSSFKNCENLKEVIFSGPTKLVYDSFIDCPSLESVYLIMTTEITEGCFTGCPNLVLHVEKDSPAEAYAIEHEIDYDYNLDYE